MAGPQALVIKKFWLDQIISGDKVWEIRSSNTKKRGRKYLAESGSGLIVGEATLVNSLAVGRIQGGKLVPFSPSKESKKNFIAHDDNMAKHRLTRKNLKELTYSEIYAWVFQDAQRYDVARPYIHNQGAVIWVNLHQGEW